MNSIKTVELINLFVLKSCEHVLERNTRMLQNLKDLGFQSGVTFSFMI